MSEQDRIAEIESLTVKEFKVELRATAQNLRDGIKPGNSVELLAAALNIGMLGDELKASLERWLQLDLWQKTGEGGA